MGMNNVNEFANDVAKFYNEYRFPALGSGGIFAYAKMKRNLFEKLGIDYSFLENKAVLEAGCGTGESTLVYSYFKPSMLVGIDIACESIQMAKNTAKALGIDARFEVMDLFNAAKLDLKFDLIFTEVLHQTQDPGEGLKRLSSLLKEDGLIIVAMAHRYGNWADALKRKILETVCRKNKDAIMKMAKTLFFNRFLLFTKSRGVRKKDNRMNQQTIIADIFLHPHRLNVSNKQFLNWLKSADLEYVSSYPSISFKGKEINITSKFIGNLKLLFGKEYHLSILARRIR
jgi:SAM-dependent methyltransferase